MGDPQAPFETVLAVLRGHGLLQQDRLRDDVQLVSMGDHFDFGAPDQRAQATADGLALVTWLASHPPEQVVLLAGNHDLARLCELGPFSTDAAFEAAFEQASRVYRHGADEAAFLSRYPHLPDAEALARDFSCFNVAQQSLVRRLFDAGRFRVAHAHRNLLLVHAGVTDDDFALLGHPPRTAAEAAALLNAESLPRLHQPGAASTGFARGIFFQRPAFPASGPEFEGPLRRRYDPRRLPAAFPQAIGHIRDQKCHQLLAPWARDAAPLDGPLRSLVVDGDDVHYARGTLPDARLYFLDGGMNYAAPARFQLFDLDARAALRPLHVEAGHDGDVVREP